MAYINSVRQGTIYIGSLAGAKAKATREQTWQGTVLKISDEDGRDIAFKDLHTGRWYGPEDWS
jgi:hypothetical protein